MVNFGKFMNKTEKKIQNYVEKVDFSPNLHEICGSTECQHQKCQMDTIGISRFPRGMNDQLPKTFSPLELIVLSKLKKS